MQPTISFFFIVEPCHKMIIKSGSKTLVTNHVYSMRGIIDCSSTLNVRSETHFSVYSLQFGARKLIFDQLPNGQLLRFPS
jgi:hypothetical protein